MDSIHYERSLSLQYQGSDTTLMNRQPVDGDYEQSFITEHKREFAFVLDAPIMIAGIRVRAASKAVDEYMNDSPYFDELARARALPVSKVNPFGTNPVYFAELGKFTDAPLYRLEDLKWSSSIHGPAIILDDTQTIVLHPHNVATILKSHVM